jgi:hypothetical protein
VKESGPALDELVLRHDVVAEFGSHKTPQKSTRLVLMLLGDSAYGQQSQDASSLLHPLVSI